jgi:hypothetical protein
MFSSFNRLKGVGIEQILVYKAGNNQSKYFPLFRHCCQTVPYNRVHSTVNQSSPRHYGRLVNQQILSDIDTQCGGPRPRPSLIALGFGS